MIAPARLNCWKCGATLPEQPLLLARRAECPECRAELHVCRMCRFYDPAMAQGCREPVAELVSDKQRSNYCGYFEPGAPAASASAAAPQEARARLDALFGAAPGAADAADPAQAARAALEKLFRK